MSFAFNNQRIQVWGVVNATPNSFSDGGAIPHAESLAQRLSDWRSLDGIDVGAESTAPMNRSISADEEKQRLTQTLLPLLKSWSTSQVLSLDTYHLETVRWLLPQVPAGVPVVWNDVSGQVDGEVISLLQEYPELRYVLCHNPAQGRHHAGHHQDYVMPGPIVPVLRSFFHRSFEIFLRHDLFSRVIADPAFGFGKTREQNHELLCQLPLLMDELACPVWMWGVSRKSFLRFPPEASAKAPVEQARLDAAGLLWAREALDKLTHPHTIILRTHAPLLARGLDNWQQVRSTWTTNS